MTALDHMPRRSKFSLHNGRHPHMASENWIRWLPKKEARKPPSEFAKSLKALPLSRCFFAKWIPGGFPGENVCR